MVIGWFKHLRSMSILKLALGAMVMVSAQNLWAQEGVKVDRPTPAMFSWGKDTIVIVHTPIYESHFSYDLHEPFMVVYKLYQGGGHNPRTGWNEHPPYQLNGHIASKSDYQHKGLEEEDWYDKGHMANKEDFASDPVNVKMTFQYFNCVPQTHELNAGCYEAWEKTIRAESQDDSLLIICGNIYRPHPAVLQTIPDDRIAIPDSCYKVVQSLRSRQILHVLIFKNDRNECKGECCKECDRSASTLPALEKRIGYRLPLIRNQLSSQR